MNRKRLGPWGKSAIAFFGALMASLAFPLVAPAESGTAAPADSDEAIVGTWSGSLDAGGGKLPIVFHIGEKSGTLTASMDSPAQGVKGIPASSAGFKSGLLAIEVASIGGGFEGRLSADGRSVEGEWKQGGRSFKLTLIKSDNAEGPARPQAPKPPFPYSTEELLIQGGAPGVVLSATLLIPEGKGPFPAVVLVTGSGPQDRDETILGHRPFLVIADYLARRGVAVLRYDDRGVASSTGDFAKATTFDFADDAQAALDALSARKELDPKRIGILGHSEGGLIAPMVAARDPKAAFIVLLAGPGLGGDSLLVLQSEALARVMGSTEEQIRDQAEANSRIFAAALAPGDDAAAAAAVRKAYIDYIDSHKELSPAEREAALDKADSIAGTVASPWMRAFLGIDPASYLHALAIPVLAMNGTKDVQVPAAEDLAAIAAAIGPRASLTTMSFEGLNHLFQHARTGSPEEYAAIEETFAPEALSAIGDWILALR